MTSRACDFFWIQHFYCISTPKQAGEMQGPEWEMLCLQGACSRETRVWAKFASR